MAGPHDDRDRVAELQRWQDAGAAWQVISRTTAGVTVALLRCDGGEEVERFTSTDARLLDFIGVRWSSDEPHG
jgi:hypothetical protein